MSPYSEEPLAAMAELLGVFTTVKHQGEFQTEGIRAVAIGADNDTEWVEQEKWAGLDESKMAWVLS